MEKKILNIFFLVVIVTLSSCGTGSKPKNNVKQGSEISVIRHKLTLMPDYYLFAFAGSQSCGFEIPSPENINKVIMENGGVLNGNAFCCKIKDGFRVFSARHTFIDCSDNPNLKVENCDVVSLPFYETKDGFEIDKPKEEDLVTIKGFRLFDEIGGTSIEWIEIKGKLEKGNLKDFSSEEYTTKKTWNFGDVWLIKTDTTLSPESLRGLSGAPVFNEEGKVVACFSGVYSIKKGKYMPNGNYLRVEELQK